MHSLTHLFTYSLTHSFTHLHTHSLTFPLSYCTLSLPDSLTYMYPFFHSRNAEQTDIMSNPERAFQSQPFYSHSLRQAHIGNSQDAHVVLELSHLDLHPASQF